MNRTIEGPVGRIHVDDGGTGGLPVVFVHSFAGNASHWKAQLTRLRKTRRALALDLRGHGESDTPANDADYRIAAMAGDVAAVADAFDLDRFVLVGHSLGGAVAAAYVAGNAGRVAGLLLAGTPGKSPPAQAQQVMGGLKADYDKVMAGYWKSLLEGAQPDVARQLESEMNRIPRGPSMAMIGAVFAFDPLPALKAYKGPLLIVDTEHGDSPAALHNQLPQAARKVIAGTSHWAHMDKPAEFNRLLDDFLASVK